MTTMWRTLHAYYDYINLVQEWTSIPARLSLALMLYLVASGYREPGRKLLTGVFGVHFLIGLFLAMEGKGWVWAIIALCAVMLAAVCWSLYAEEQQWDVLPEEDPWRKLAWAAYAVAFFYPVWDRVPIYRGFLLSPMGTLPQQSLLALMILVAVTGRKAPSLLVYTGIGAALVFSVLDFTMGNRGLGVLLFLGGMAAISRLVRDHLSERSSEEVAPTTLRSWTPKQREEASEQEDRSSRKWNLK